MRLCLILIIAISALSTEAAPNVETSLQLSHTIEDKQEVSGSDKPQEGFENGYFGYGWPYGGGRGFTRYGAYGPGYGYGYGYGGGNRQEDWIGFWCWEYCYGRRLTREECCEREPECCKYLGPLD